MGYDRHARVSCIAPVPPGLRIRPRYWGCPRSGQKTRSGDCANHSVPLQAVKAGDFLTFSSFLVADTATNPREPRFSTRFNTVRLLIGNLSPIAQNNTHAKRNGSRDSALPEKIRQKVATEALGRQGEAARSYIKTNRRQRPRTLGIGTQLREAKEGLPGWPRQTL